jgi:hypothetical protein
MARSASSLSQKGSGRGPGAPSARPPGIGTLCSGLIFPAAKLECDAYACVADFVGKSAIVHGAGENHAAHTQSRDGACPGVTPPLLRRRAAFENVNHRPQHVLKSAFGALAASPRYRPAMPPWGRSSRRPQNAGVGGTPFALDIVPDRTHSSRGCPILGEAKSVRQGPQHRLRSGLSLSHLNLVKPLIPSVSRQVAHSRLRIKCGSMSHLLYILCHTITRR